MDKVAKDIQPQFLCAKDQAISELEKVRQLAGQCLDKQEAWVANGLSHEQKCLPASIPDCENTAASSSCVAYETGDTYSPISQVDGDTGRWCMKCSAAVRGNEFICAQCEQPTNEMGKPPMSDDVPQTFGRASSDRVGAAHSQTTAKVEMIPAQSFLSMDEVVCIKTDSEEDILRLFDKSLSLVPQAKTTFHSLELQQKAKPHLPPNTSIWRDLTTEVWRAHVRPHKRISEQWRAHGGQYEALRALVQRCWMQHKDSDLRQMDNARHNMHSTVADESCASDDAKGDLPSTPTIPSSSVSSRLLDTSLSPEKSANPTVKRQRLREGATNKFQEAPSQDNSPQTQGSAAPSAMSDAPQVIPQWLTSQYRKELTRFEKPMSEKDIHVRMLKLHLYDAQKTRTINGKHAKKLLQFVQQSRLAVQEVPPQDKDLKDSKFLDRDTLEQGHHPKVCALAGIKKEL